MRTYGQFLAKSLLLSAVLAATPGVSDVFAADEESAQRKLKLVFFSDVHARTEWGTPDAMARAAAAMNAQEPNLVIGGGDLITDGFQSSAASVESRWDAYMAMHNALKGSVHSVIGNHDLVAAIPEDGTQPSDDPRSVFRERLGVDRTYYSFDINGYHVMLLDSMQIAGDRTKYQGAIGAEQLAWIKSDLKSVPRHQPIIIAMHIPLLTSFYQATQGATAVAPAGRVIVNNLDVLDLFRNHNLLLVLQGHLHVSESIRWKHTTFITGGAVSGRWWRGPWHGTEEGFTVVTLDGNDVEWEYVTYGWQARRPPDQ
ncbi:MAG: metallophosphoesterase [Gammaproteobacteria bacterium]|nr:metallophosphoesterase [Gammaproteobacteria bacterium]